MLKEDYTLLLAAIVFFIVGGLVVFYFGGMLTPQESEEEKLFLQTIKSITERDYENYVYSYYSTVGEFEWRYLERKHGDSMYLELETPVDKEELYFIDGRKILCVSYVETYVCSDELTNDSEKYFDSLIAGFPTKESAEQTYEKNEKLVEYGAITFYGVGKENVILRNGIQANVSVLSYLVNYSSLSVGQLIDVGAENISKIIDEFNHTILILNGVIVKRITTYTYGGQEVTSVYELDEAVWGESEEVTFNGELVSNKEFSVYFEQVQEDQETAKACAAKDGEEKNICFHNAAVNTLNEKFCTFSEDREERCILQVALERGSVGLCEMLEGDWKDDCYLEFAWKEKDVSYCDYISSQQKKEECINISVEQ